VTRSPLDPQVGLGGNHTTIGCAVSYDWCRHHRHADTGKGPFRERAVDAIRLSARTGPGVWCKKSFACLSCIEGRHDLAGSGHIAWVGRSGECPLRWLRGGDVSRETLLWHFFVIVPKIVDQPRFAGPRKIVRGPSVQNYPPARPNFSRCPNDFALRVLFET